MIQIALVDSELSAKNDDIIRQIINDNNRASGRFCREKEMRENERESSSTSSCQSLLTIHQCSSANTQMIENIREKSPARFSYLIRPITPCIFGTENYNDEEINDDEFFVTAGGIIHSCPNIYELSIEVEYHHRKLQSCDHLMVIHKDLNTYDTKCDRYSVLPRFQPISSSLSTDSISSEIELYKERHAIGLSQRYYNTTSVLPTTWRSDNYLLFMPFVDHHQHSLSLNSIDGNKRSRSYEFPNGQTLSSIVA